MKTTTQTKHRLRGWALASAVMVAGTALGITGTGSAHADGPATGAVKQVDHVLVGCSDDATAQSVFNQFTSAQGFDLPVAWPFVNYGTFSSGGVYFGSGGTVGLNLEVGVFNNSSFAPAPVQYQSPPAGTCRFVGFAFEPGGSQPGGSQTQAENALQSAGISYLEQNQQNPAFSPPFAFMHAWTNIQPTGLSSPVPDPNKVWLQISAYDNAWLQTGGWANIEAYKAADQPQFDAVHGGPLTVTNAENVTIGSVNKDADIAGLNQLLAPVTAGNSKYEFASGPSITVRQNSTEPEGIASLTIHVANLGAARSYLQSHGMLGEDDGDHLFVAPSAVGGLTVQLTQS